MRSRRVTTVCLLALASLSMLGPAWALANGPSAGDNQYTDPLAGPPHPKHHKTTTTTSTPAPAPSSTGTSSAPTSTSTTAVAATSTSATTTSSNKSLKKDPNLPHTGYDSWLAAAIGASLLGVGVAVRRRVGPQSGR